MDIEKIRSLVVQGKYEFSKHAEREREVDMIHIWELEDALRDCEIIEYYPDDPRGASCLVLGFSGPKPIHAVCTVKAALKSCCLSLFTIRPSGLISGPKITGKGGELYAQSLS